MVLINKVDTVYGNRSQVVFICSPGQIMKIDLLQMGSIVKSSEWINLAISTKLHRTE